MVSSATRKQNKNEEEEENDERRTKGPLLKLTNQRQMQTTLYQAEVQI